MMTPWFDRTFDFSFGVEKYTGLLERLRQAPALYNEMAAPLTDAITQRQPGGKWSVKENIGHLLILEPLWQSRFREIKAKMQALSPADLSNAATSGAQFNTRPLQELLADFAATRAVTTGFLENLQEEDLAHGSLHPRLGVPMHMIDMMYFVAEHDMHHLETIRDIAGRYAG